MFCRKGRGQAALVRKGRVRVVRRVGRRDGMVSGFMLV
jgi:hypothetical protein